MAFQESRQNQRRTPPFLSSAAPRPG